MQQQPQLYDPDVRDALLEGPVPGSSSKKSELKQIDEDIVEQSYSSGKGLSGKQKKQMAQKAQELEYKFLDEEEEKCEQQDEQVSAFSIQPAQRQQQPRFK